MEWFTDGSSLVQNGEWRAGYAIVSSHDVIEVRSLPSGTLAQKAELIALVRALQLG